MRSPDGKRIAFGSNEGGAYKVWIVDADGANRRQFAKTQLSSSAELTWAPGRHILYQTPGNRNFNTLDPETDEEKPLVQNESVGYLFNPKYSPDGKKVAVLWNRPPQDALWVISLIDGSQTFLSSVAVIGPPGGRLTEVRYMPRSTFQHRRQNAVDFRGPRGPWRPAHHFCNSGTYHRRYCERGREKLCFLRSGIEIG